MVERTDDAAKTRVAARRPIAALCGLAAPEAPGARQDTKSPKIPAVMGVKGWIAMGRAEAFSGRMSSAVLLTFLGAVIASAVAFIVLYAVYAPQAPDAADRSADLTTVGDGMSAEERRELTRQMLKARRENPEIPAEVRPVPSSRPATPTTADATLSGSADIKARPDRPGSTPPARVAARNKPDTALASVASTGTAPVNIAPNGMQNSAVGAGQGPLPSGTAAPGVTLPPVVVSSPGVKPPQGAIAGDPNAAPGPGANGDPATPAAPVQRGFVANVFSTISVFAGSAANVTGNTVNWVIDLPGKAISAGSKLGGKLLGGDTGPGSSPTPQSSQSPPPKGS
jgi:uncharacterized membrane protein